MFSTFSRKKKKRLNKSYIFTLKGLTEAWLTPYILAMLTELEKKVIASIQGDLPIVPRPYKAIAQSLGISEEILLEIVTKLRDEGIMRRFGATLRHQKTGFEANAMTAWQVEEERILEVGKIMASFKEVSHCYRRNPTDQWPFNLYTMIHGTSEAECRETARKMAEMAGIGNYHLLFSKKELKKTSMKYFSSV
jgi:DNA-binding Lrp family transcriptional regulator